MPSVDRAEALIVLSGLQDPLETLGYTVIVDRSSASVRITRPAVDPASVVIIGLNASPTAGLHLVSLDAPYPFAILGGRRDNVVEAIGIVNNYMPAGVLVIDSDDVIHAVWTIPSDAAESLGIASTVEAIATFDQLQQHFGDYIEGACTGAIPANTLDDLIEAAGDGY